MTRETAIALLNNLRAFAEDDDEPAIDMAIEVLKAQTDGDLISRRDVVNEIHKYFVEEIDKTPTEIDEDGDEVFTDMPTVNSLLACNKELSKRIKSLPSAETPTVLEKHQLSEEISTNTPTDLISRQDALDALQSRQAEVREYSAIEYDNGIETALCEIKALPSAEPNTAIMIYNFLKKKIGSKIIDNPFEFEDWYNRMIWHVQECYKLRKKYEADKMAEPKTRRWTWDDKGYFYCSCCGKMPNDQTSTTDFCPNCGADMRGE